MWKVGRIVKLLKGQLYPLSEYLVDDINVTKEVATPERDMFQPRQLVIKYPYSKMLTLYLKNAPENVGTIVKGGNATVRTGERSLE